MVLLEVRVLAPQVRQNRRRLRDQSPFKPQIMRVRNKGIPFFKDLLAQSSNLKALAEDLQQLQPGEAARRLEEAISLAAVSAFPTPKSRQQFVSSPQWFDKNCRTARRKLLDTLRSEGPSHLSSQLKKEFRNMVRRKKREFNKYRAAKLEDQMLNSPSSFWKQYRKRRRGLGGEHEAGLVSHCKALYEQPGVGQGQQGGATAAGLESGGSRPSNERGATSRLEARVSEAEVRAAIRSLKNGKSAVLQGFTAELLKVGENELVAGLVAVFNRVFEEGVFPASWNEGVLVAIFKKGDPSDYGNYWTVTVAPSWESCMPRS